MGEQTVGLIDVGALLTLSLATHAGKWRTNRAVGQVELCRLDHRRGLLDVGGGRFIASGCIIQVSLRQGIERRQRLDAIQVGARHGQTGLIAIERRALRVQLRLEWFGVDREHHLPFRDNFALGVGLALDKTVDPRAYLDFMGATRVRDEFAADRNIALGHCDEAHRGRRSRRSGSAGLVSTRGQQQAGDHAKQSGNQTRTGKYTAEQRHRICKHVSPALVFVLDQI